MDAWSDLTTGSNVTLGIIQVDIAGHSKLTGPAFEIQKSKEIFRRHVENIVDDYDGRLFNWAGDGGAYMFRIQKGDEYANMVFAATSILRHLPIINDEIAFQTNVIQPFAIRISCDAGNVSYDSDPANIHGDFINKLFKNERAISIVDDVTITERVFNQLPNNLSGKFHFHKNSEEVGSKIYKFRRDIGHHSTPAQSIVSDDEVIRELKETIRRNHVFSREVEVIRFVKEVPELRNVGVIELAPNVREQTEQALREEGRYYVNDSHAVLSEEPVWEDQPIILRYKSTDYFGICSLSNNNTTPVKTLSSSVVVICSQKRELYLHRRAAVSRTYPSCLHTMGGACKPDEDVDLIETAQRELKEEAKLHFQRSGGIPMMMVREPKTGFIQLVLLGVEVTPEEVEFRKDSWEGDVVVIGFDSLPNKLLTPLDNIVPTGLIHVLAWLGLNAPPLSQEERFGGHKARELYLKVLGKLKGD